MGLPSHGVAAIGGAAIGAATTLHGRQTRRPGPPVPASEPLDGNRLSAIVKALVANVQGDGTLDLGASLRGLCDDLARRFDRLNTPSLSCTVADHDLPSATVVILRQITSILVSDAYAHGFAPDRGGRIAVSFLVLEADFALTIEDSGRVDAAASARRADGVAAAALLVGALGGWIATPRVVAGRSYVISLPRCLNAAPR